MSIDRDQLGRWGDKAGLNDFKPRRRHFKGLCMVEVEAAGTQDSLRNTDKTMSSKKWVSSERPI